MRSWAFHGGSNSPDASCPTQALVEAAAMLSSIASSSSKGSMPGRQYTSLGGPSIDGRCRSFNQSSGDQQHVMEDLGVVVTVTSSGGCYWGAMLMHTRTMARAFNSKPSLHQQ